MFWTLFGRRQPRTRIPHRRPKLVGSIECLEERLTPDASFFALATGPFVQNWSTAPITADNDWSTVPSIIGYNGAGLATPGTDPQTVLADGGAPTVLSNQTDPSSLAAAGIAEFSTLAKPTVALAADSTDQAPFLLLSLNTSQTRNVHVSFNLRDLVSSASSLAEPFALQYRIGASGDFTNLATGFVGDATNGANPGNLVTPVSVTLPGDAYDQPQLQLRIITTDPGGAARWIGVDDINVTGTAAPLTFSIDSANSSLALSGDFAGTPFQEQAPGSLTTHYSGTVAAVWDRAAGTINFLSAGTDAVAANSGSWQPLPGGVLPGDAPANYGVQVPTGLGSILAAFRELHVALSTSAPLSLTGSGPYSFASIQRYAVTAGFEDINAGALGSGRADATSSGDNTSATAGTLEDLGSGNYRLTIPIDVTITAMSGGFTIHYHTQGTIVANATSPVAPELPIVDLNGPNPGADNLAGFVQGGPAVAIAANATVTDTASANLTTAYVTLTNRPDGTAESLAAVTGVGLTASYDAASGRLTIRGSAPLSVYQAVLQSVTYNDTAAAANITTANRLVEFTVSDGANNSPLRTAVVTIAATRTPLVNNVPPDQATPVDTPLTFSSAGGNGISISDPNPAPTAGIVQVMLSVSNGTLTLASLSGLTIMSGANGSSTITIRGTLADINAALDGLVYASSAGFSGADTLTILSDDLLDTDATGTVHHNTSLSMVAITVG